MTGQGQRSGELAEVMHNGATHATDRDANNLFGMEPSLMEGIAGLAQHKESRSRINMIYDVAQPAVP